MVVTTKTQAWMYRVLVHDIGVSKYKSLHLSKRLKRVVKGLHWMHNAQHYKQWEAIQDVRKRIKNNTL